MNFYCENCGQSEIGMSSIVCDYSGCRTWRDGCCEMDGDEMNRKRVTGNE